MRQSGQTIANANNERDASQFGDSSRRGARIGAKKELTKLRRMTLINSERC
jgi:hypothetical protein